MIRIWQEFVLVASEESKPSIVRLRSFSKFLMALRSDLGNSNEDIDVDCLLKLIVNDLDEYLKKSEGLGNDAPS